jgi:Ca2+-dependent lipid-binding protein
VVIWDTKDVINADIEGTSDVFIRAFFDPKNAKETDTHYRCTTGAASFNYRLLYTINAPMDNYNFVVQCWDRDFFASNDLIGECNLDLKPLIEDVIETNRSF